MSVGWIATMAASPVGASTQTMIHVCCLASKTMAWQKPPSWVRNWRRRAVGDIGSCRSKSIWSSMRVSKNGSVLTSESSQASTSGSYKGSAMASPGGNVAATASPADETLTLVGQRYTLLKSVVGQQSGFGCADCHRRFEHQSTVRLFPKQELSIGQPKRKPATSIRPHWPGLRNGRHAF